MSSQRAREYGDQGGTLRFMPALNVTRDEIDQMLTLLEATLRED